MKQSLLFAEETESKDESTDAVFFVPLSQGYGTHYVTVWVWSPTPQRKSVIVDTGSHYTTFPCKSCDNCGEEYHTDQYFDHDMSSSFHVLTVKSYTEGSSCWW